MSMEVFLTSAVRSLAEDFFSEEKINGIEIHGIDVSRVSAGDFVIDLSGRYAEDFNYILKEYYLMKAIREEAETAVYDAPDSTLSDTALNNLVDKLWKKVEDLQDEIYEVVDEEMYEQVSYIQNDFNYLVYNDYFSASIVGGGEIVETSLKNAIEQEYGSMSIYIHTNALYPEVLNMDKDTLRTFIENI